MGNIFDGWLETETPRKGATANAVASFERFHAKSTTIYSQTWLKRLQQRIEFKQPFLEVPSMTRYAPFGRMSASAASVPISMLRCGTILLC